jgi:hypothetical protein
MAAEAMVRQWATGDGKGLRITPEGARDLIVRCFHDTHRGTLLQARRRLGAEGEDTFQTAQGVVRFAFAAVGAAFDAPDCEGLRRVAELLHRKARVWGTPAPLLDAHVRRLQQVLRLVTS